MGGMMSNMNGHTIDEMGLAIRDIARLTEATKVPFEEAEPIISGPFSQAEHDDMLKQLDALATDWVRQLRYMREHCDALEREVLQRTAKTKSDVTQLHMLGNAAMLEARRGTEIAARLMSELQRLREQG
jgi:hypothetical protein